MYNIDICCDIGRQMRQIRQHLNMTQKEIATAINESAALLSYYENNKRQQSVDVLRKFLLYCRNDVVPVDSYNNV